MLSKITPLNAIDFYKADHRSQYPKGTETVFSNWTPRGSRFSDLTEVVFFGLQYYMLEYMEKQWSRCFFEQSKDEVVAAYSRRMKTSGINIEVDHVEALHDLGYLPIEIWALPEGTTVPFGIPMFVIRNIEEHPEFSWLVNYLETSLSHTMWGMCTSATIAKDYRRISTKYTKISGGAPEFIDWQNHDFSCRGMFGFEASMMSGAGHLLSFTGTDTVSAIDFLEEYYGANADIEMVGGSVPATEHSVMSMGGEMNELDTYRRLLTEVYPSGVVSIVSDTWDYWQVWTQILPTLKAEVMSREGTVVIRPDSGDPYKIIVGDEDAEPGSPEYKGSFTLAWELFGGTVNDKGFKVLDSHIGLIYGEKITRALAERIYQGLIAKGFVPTCVLGIGSYTYQYNTRDTFGFAMKATYGEVNGKGRAIFKKPKTDDGSKTSAKGLLAVHHNYATGKLVLHQDVTWDAVTNCEFRQVFCKRVVLTQTLSEVRKLVQAE